MSPPETIEAALRAAVVRLAATSETPRLDTELLMAHALGVTREALLLSGLDQPLCPVRLDPVEGRALSAAIVARHSTSLRPNGGMAFEALIARRLAGEPLAYITGRRDFWTICLAVAPGVLIPRPDSETLIEAAVAYFAGTPGPKRVLDLGTGSGALLLAALAEWPNATGVGVDCSLEALTVAEANATRLGMRDRVRMIEGGWAGTGEVFDLILCNPPYIATDEMLPRDVVDYEPHMALFAGGDGLDAYRALSPLLPAQLAAGGVVCIEIGVSQGGAVSSLIASQGLVVQIRHDLAERDRCIVATRR